MKSFEQTELRLVAVVLSGLILCTSAAASPGSTLHLTGDQFGNDQLGTSGDIAWSVTRDTASAGSPHPVPQPVETARWVSATGLSPNASLLLARIDDLDTHGLEPEAFDLVGLRAGIERIFGDPDKRHQRTFPVAVAALDYRFRRAFSEVATALGQGVVDARSVQRRLFREPPETNVPALLARLDAGAATVADLLDEVAPSHAAYQRLRAVTKRLLDERDGGATPFPTTSPDADSVSYGVRSNGARRTDAGPGGSTRQTVRGRGSLQEGQASHEVEQLRRRLMETGELAYDPTPAPRFDAELTEAVKAFQKRHGIAADGIVARRTLAALNRSVEDDLGDVAMALERWRWMPRQLGERYVFVNLPDYRLQLIDKNRRVADMAVVIGKTKHQTPSFSRALSYLEFNPTWTVPVSITNKELIPLERRNPGYLAARDFTLLRAVDGRVDTVPLDAMTETDLATVPFPYTLRQRGGGNNALGRMKFMMPNPYSIYLHDTPAKELFSKHERAYSHGCIRLAEPELLARHLLQLDGLTPNTIAGAIANPSTHRVSLQTPVPTHLTYFTTWVDDSDALQHRGDIYGHDEALRSALHAYRERPHTQLAKMSASVASN